MGLVTMSQQEISRLRILADLAERRTTHRLAAELLGISRRQLFRLRDRYLANGAAGLVSRKRGKPSNRCFPEALRRQVIEIIKECYPDFGPTLASEKLQQRHDIVVGPETLRLWMRSEGIWIDRRNRKKVYQPRYRRECPGELVQIDGSEHYWFEDRGPQCTLLVYIDDATSRLMHLKFVESESAFAYFASTREYLEEHGKPVAFYSDKHSIFRVARKGAIAGDGMTQFGRALHDLNIDIICADTPQAKGRVERANRTLQDRLVKELRLAGIDSIEHGNLLLPAFLEDYNARFAKVPRNPKDLHRPLAPGEDLGDVFAWREERTVSAALTVQYDKVLFILEQNDITRGLVRKRVTISDYPDGRLIITHNGLPLAYRIFDKVRQVNQGAIVDNKRLSAVLAMIKQQQELAPQRRSQSAPGRRSQSSQLFALPPIAALPTPDIAQLSSAPERLPDLREMWLPEEKRTEPEQVKEAPLLADADLAPIVADFRLGNRYIVQKRCRKTARGRPKKLKGLEPVTPELIDALPIGEGRLSAALALDRFYREAA